MKCLAPALVLSFALCTSRVESQTFTTLIQFTGSSGTATGYGPYGSLTLSGTTLFGMTVQGGASGNGNIFSVGTDGRSYKNLLPFTGTSGSASGKSPKGSLTPSGTTFYSMTGLGGANGVGNVFSVAANGTNYRNLASFTGSSGTAIGAGAGSRLTLIGTTLFGMTPTGGMSAFGNVFSVSTAGTNYKNLVSFTGSSGSATGNSPAGSLTLVGTSLYGMTPYGGPVGAGNIFSVGTNGTSYRNLVSFTGTSGTASGSSPLGSLALSGTRLYGMTENGGGTGQGNVFSVGTNGTSFQNLVSFTGTSGSATGLAPQGSLLISGSTLYGMTSGGGALGNGNIFSVGINGLGYQNLYGFTGGTGGSGPVGDLTISAGTLFGMAPFGGTGGGTLFAFALPLNTWARSGGGSWNAASNWTSGTIPNGAGLQATLGTSLTSSSTITLDVNQSVGLLTFNNGAASYTLSPGSGGTLTLNNAGSAPSQVVVLAGTHSITAPVVIAGGNLTLTESSSARLAIAGNISDDNGAESLTLGGDGTGILVLSGTNNYGGGTIVQAGKLLVTNPAALPDGGNLTVGGQAGSISAPVIPTVQSADAAAVPEPSTLVLLGLGTVGSMRLRRRN
jgi:autotransporter-associated beta strand protein/uncharacterized repeat protein (TIGR03803 family)